MRDHWSPGQNLPWYTTAQIEGCNGACWSNAEYDRLSAEQASETDPRRRGGPAEEE